MSTSSTVTARAEGTSAVARLATSLVPRKLIGGAITGPAGSRVNVYIGTISTADRIDQTSRGQSNSFDYASPRTIGPGAVAIIEWPGQSAKATQCVATFITEDGS